MFFRTWLLTFPLLLLADAPSGYTVRTIAGNNLAGDGGPATAAIVSQPEGLAADANGNLYFADADDCRIRKINSTGQIQTVAGTGIAGFNGESGPALTIQLNHPYGIALDTQNNLYIADLGNSRVRRLGPDGALVTIAGGGSFSAGSNSDGLPATAIKLNAPRNVAVDSAGNVYVSDFGANQVYRINPGGTVTTIAGSGTAGFGGDSGLAKSATLSAPAGLAVDSIGGLYIADSGNGRIRRITGGIITTVFSTPSPTGLAINASGTLYIAASGYFGTLAHAVGQGLSALDVATALDGSLYLSVGNTVRRVAPDGTVAVFAGNGASRYYGGDGGPATLARLHNPASVAVDDLGNIFIADTGNQRIRKISAGGVMTTFAGSGDQGSSNPNGNALLAQLNNPLGLALDSLRNLYVADSGNNRVCKISASGAFSVLIDKLSDPQAVAVDDNNAIYVADTGNDRVIQITSTGVLSNIIQVLKPAGLAVDNNGTLYISESSRVSKIPNGGVLTTVLDGQQNPRGLALTTDGDLVIAEAGANRIKVLSSGGVVTAYGSGLPGYGGDTGDTNPLQFNTPSGVAVDSGGHILVADTGNQRIRMLTPASSGGPAPLNVSPLSLFNAASMASGPIAPNEIVTIFGTGFDATQTQVLFDGKPATLFYVGANQINALTPASVTPGGQSDVIVMVKGSQTAESLLPVTAVSPALFTGQSGQAAALNEDGSYNTGVTPAARGSVVSLYATGWNGNPTVTANIGSYAAEVLFAGAAPGFLGLQQINVRVPAGFLPPGPQPVVLTVSGSQTQAGVTISVK